MRIINSSIETCNKKDCFLQITALLLGVTSDDSGEKEKKTVQKLSTY